MNKYERGINLLVYLSARRRTSVLPKIQSIPLSKSIFSIPRHVTNDFFTFSDDVLNLSDFHCHPLNHLFPKYVQEYFFYIYLHENRDINIGYQCCPCRKSNRGIQIFADNRAVYRENNVIIVTMCISCGVVSTDVISEKWWVIFLIIKIIDYHYNGS